MLLRICEGWKGCTFVVGVMKLYACTVKNVWHLNVKNARVKSWYYVMRYTICNLVINGLGLR